MKNRRTILMGLSCSVVALGLVVGSVLADELVGRITKVNVEDKTIVVTEKGTHKEVDVKTNDDTVVETPKGEHKLDLDRLKKGVEKSEHGIHAVVTHEKGVASKIKIEPRKDGDRKGGEHKGGEHKGGEHKGGEHKGGEHKGGEHKGGDREKGEPKS